MELDLAFLEGVGVEPFLLSSPDFAVIDIAGFRFDLGEVEYSFYRDHFSLQIGRRKYGIDNILIEIHGIGE